MARYADKIAALKTDEVGLILLTAASIMEQRGYCADGANGDDGEVCFIVAISDALNMPWSHERDRLTHAAWDRFTAHVWGEPERGGIMRYQKICRSKAQAVGALRGAALASTKCEGE